MKRLKRLCHPQLSLQHLMPSLAIRSYVMIIVPRIPSSRHKPSTTILLKLPVSVIQRTHLSRLQPTRDTVEVESVLYPLSQHHIISHQPSPALWNYTHVANTPSNSTLLASSASLVGLAVNAQIHNVVAADGAVVYNNIPGPERDCVPLCM